MPGPDPIPADTFVRVGTLEELKAKGMTVVHGHHATVLVACDGARCFAVDNRCPHLGFPLQRGSVKDGILTCHWHHARFDLMSGGGFDLWADDLPTAAVQVRDGVVWVSTELRYPDGSAHWKNRLRVGMEHNVGLVIAKGILGLRMQGANAQQLVREAATFGARQRPGWGAGLTVLTALGNLLPALPEEETHLALYKAIRQVATDCEGQAARRARELLDRGPQLETLARWLRHWTAVRHRDGAERTLLTAIAGEAEAGEVAEAMLVAATDRVFADGGHTVDFINKAFELLELIGWEHAALVLPTTLDLLTSARGAEESNAWRHPVDLVNLCTDAAGELPAAIALGRRRSGRWNALDTLTQTLLDDSAPAIADGIITAVREGAKAPEMGRTLCYAAALRVARFGTANEHSDWESAHHAFTYANALHRMLVRLDAGGRVPTMETLRGLLHGAMFVHLLRFLNVPQVRLPGEDNDRLDDLPQSAASLCAGFLDALDRHGEIEAAARHVARYLAVGHDERALIATLAHAVLREDAGFHTYQMLEAGVRQFREWGNGVEGRRILVAVARYIAAHTPTERAELQTAIVARKLATGQALHETDASAETGALG